MDTEVNTRHTPIGEPEDAEAFLPSGPRDIKPGDLFIVEPVNYPDRTGPWKVRGHGSAGFHMSPATRGAGHTVLFWRYGERWPENNDHHRILRPARRRGDEGRP